MTHAFIVRLWSEGREIPGAPARWRGTIEHIGTGERRALDCPDDVCRIIRSRLDTPAQGWWRRVLATLRWRAR